MQWWHAVVLGLVEGLTEYLPVSSTGHLLVVQALLGIGTEGERAKAAADAYAVCIQSGAILAVLGLYVGRVKSMARGLLGQDPAGMKLLVNLLAAFVPAVVLGLAFNKLIKSHLFGPWPVVAAWLVGGLAILAVVRWQGAKRAMPQAGLSLDQVTLKIALLIGIAQCLAMWPGTSRSLVTILAGLLLGLSLMAAVEFAFLLGVITLGAATVYDFLKHGELMLEEYGPVNLAIGFVVSLVSAAFAVKWMVAYLNRHSLAVFGWYRLAIAVVVAALLAAGIM